MQQDVSIGGRGTRTDRVPGSRLHAGGVLPIRRRSDSHRRRPDDPAHDVARGIRPAGSVPEEAVSDSWTSHRSVTWLTRCKVCDAAIHGPTSGVQWPWSSARSSFSAIWAPGCRSGEAPEARWKLDLHGLGAGALEALEDRLCGCPGATTTESTQTAPGERYRPSPVR